MTGQGELIADRYRLLTRIGHGAMGVVWRAQDELLDRVVAVKQLLRDPDDLADNEGHREGRVAAQLRHPHAIMVHDAVEHADQRYLVMEYFPSRSLAALVEDGGPLTQEAVARIGHQVAGALAAAHGAGIVHRDIKPANVLVDSDGTAKIADFGISRALGDGTMTGGAIVAGTPAYLAPEVASGDHAGFSSDVFSFGATLYAALVGAPPFGFHKNPITMLRRVAAAVIVPPRRSGPLVDVLLWMLRRHPGERPTMHEAHDALAAVLDGRPTGAPPPEPAPEQVAPWITAPLPRVRRRSRRLIGLGVAAVVLVAVGVLIGTLIPSQELPAVTADPGPTGEGPGQVPTGSAPPNATVPTTTATTETVTHSASSPASTPNAVTQPAPGCVAKYRVQGRWQGGYQAEVTVVNGPELAIAGWIVRWALPGGHTITNLWNGSPSQSGNAITVSNLDWNGKVPPNGSTTFGLTVTAPIEQNPFVGDISVLSCQSQ